MDSIVHESEVPRVLHPESSPEGSVNGVIFHGDAPSPSHSEAKLPVSADCVPPDLDVLCMLPDGNSGAEIPNYPIVPDYIVITAVLGPIRGRQHDNPPDIISIDNIADDSIVVGPTEADALLVFDDRIIGDKGLIREADSNAREPVPPSIILDNPVPVTVIGEENPVISVVDGSILDQGIVVGVSADVDAIDPVPTRCIIDKTTVRSPCEPHALPPVRHDDVLHRDVRDLVRVSDPDALRRMTLFVVARTLPTRAIDSMALAVEHNIARKYVDTVIRGAIDDIFG